MDFRQLQSFTEVVRQGSFTRAAEVLFISQPTISLRIRELERELGTSLIRRSTRSIELTDKGREVFEYAEGILALRDRIGSCCLPESRRVIRIGASTIPSAWVLPDLVAAFLKDHPCVAFDITRGDSSTVAEGVASRLYDLGFTGMPSGMAELTEEPVATDHLVLITPAAEHFRELKETFDAGCAGGLSPSDSPEALAILRQLLKEPFIMREEGSGSLKKAAVLLENAGISLDSLRTCVRTNDQEAILGLVAAGAGISVLSGQAARTSADAGRILCFDLAQAAGERDLYMLCLKHDTLPRHVQDFVRLVRTRPNRTDS